MKPELRDRALRTTSAMLTGAGSLLVPNIAHAESPSKLLAANDPIFLQGDGSNNNHLKVLLIGQNGTTLSMLEEVKDDLFYISPMDEFRPITDVAGILGGNELGCNQVNFCDWGKVNEVINGYLARGLVFHETMVVIKSNDEGGTGFVPILPSHLTKADIYSPSVVVRPVDTRFTRTGNAGTVVHEFLHQFAGFDHEGGDIMERKCNCINTQHTQFLRALRLLVPFNYGLPQLALKPVPLSAAALNAAGVYQLSDMSFAFAAQSPWGTTQLYSELRPFNDDGAGAFDYVGTQLGVQAWRDTGRRIPAPPEWYGLLPDMTYTWKIRASNLAVPLSANDPRWIQDEAWPGVWLPNPAAEIKIHTPKRLSDTITLTSPPTTDDRTPVLTWTNKDPQVFYYEVQLSKDPTFNTDPATATAMVYWELRHGGVTNPPNSYTVPNSYPLEAGGKYYLRVRPRVQGDGTPVPWTPAQELTVTSNATIKSHLDDLADKNYGNGVIGPSQTDYDRAEAQHDVSSSPLAKVHQTGSGEIFIPEAVLPKEEDL